MRNIRFLTTFLLLIFCISLAGCVRAEVVESKVEVPAFTLTIDGTEYTQDFFADLTVYQCQATSTNRYGTEETYLYVGYRLSDVLNKAGTAYENGVTAVGSDGYEVDLTPKETKDATTLVAFLRDGKPSAEAGTVSVVPCKNDFSPDYAKTVTELIPIGGDALEKQAA